jgi:hypothetical protein
MKVFFSALGPKLVEQIPNLPDFYDADSDCITRLFIRGLLTEKETGNARKRLIKEIENWNRERK